MKILYVDENKQFTQSPELVTDGTSNVTLDPDSKGPVLSQYMDFSRRILGIYNTTDLVPSKTNFSICCNLSQFLHFFFFPVQLLSFVWNLWPHGLQHSRPPCPSPALGVYSNSCLLSWWCHPTISSSVVLSPPTFKLSQHQDLFKWVSSLHQVARVLEFQLHHQSFQWIFRTDFL